MSERRPPSPAPHASSASLSDPNADTPREGTPAFGDTPIDGSPALGESGDVAVAGPSPDHASAYVPPRELPKPADHKTIEVSPIRISPEADPRRARTQKAMHVVKREEAQRHLMLLGVDATAATPSARAPQTSDAELDSGSKSRAGLIIGGGIVLMVLVAIGFIVFNVLNPEPGGVTATSTSASGGQSPVAAAATALAPTALARPTPGATLAPAAEHTAVAPEPSPAPSAAAAPSTSSGKKKKKPDETPKPINE